jgi:hypothetical protein
MPFFRDKAHDGVLCTFSTRTSATAAGYARSSQLSSPIPGQAVRSVREGGMDPNGPTSITTQISPVWVTLLQPAMPASVLGQLSSLKPHWRGINNTPVHSKNFPVPTVYNSFLHTLDNNILINIKACTTLPAYFKTWFLYASGKFYAPYRNDFDGEAASREVI